MKCPACESSLWDGTACGACRHGTPTTSPAPAPNPWEVTRQHFDDLRAKAFWTALGVSALLFPSPALATKLLESPSAGAEEATTLLVVLLHTLPLTAAVAVDAGVLMRYGRRPDSFPKTDGGKWTLGACLAGVVFASMVLGGWAGQVAMSDWSRARADEVSALHRAVDPTGKTTKHFGQGLAHHAAKSKAGAAVLLVVLVIAGAGVAVLNYFTLYGPWLFLSSLAVGAFLGWVWAVKLPDALADIDKSLRQAAEANAVDRGGPPGG